MRLAHPLTSGVNCSMFTKRIIDAVIFVFVVIVFDVAVERTSLWIVIDSPTPTLSDTGHPLTSGMNHSIFKKELFKTTG